MRIPRSSVDKAKSQEGREGRREGEGEGAAAEEGSLQRA
jgi:hypothetical protein